MILFFCLAFLIGERFIILKALLFYLEVVFFSFVMGVFEIVVGAGFETSRTIREDKQLMPIRSLVSNFAKVENFFLALVLEERT